MVSYFNKTLIIIFYLVFISIFLLFFFDTIQAQHINNIDYILNKIEITNFANNIPQDSTSNSLITSETKYLGIGLIKFYQLFVSTQDKPSCNFTLSCSHFGMEAIEHRGFIIGTLLTADRLTRCNDIARSYYKIDSVTKKAIDPVPFYEFRNKIR